MILYGAGSSIPFDIPGMSGFTELFMKEKEDIATLFSEIQNGISESKETIGVSIEFDLEARQKYGSQSSMIKDLLLEFIFNVCMKPIRKGMKEGNFNFLNRLYGPLMTVLNKTKLENLQNEVRSVFSTNWDLCFKTWADYVNLPINDGTEIDRQSLPVLSMSKIGDASFGFSYVPLHGSLDLIKVDRPKGAGVYEDVRKISDPLRYFGGNRDNLKNVFMIYPLEAIGYEESVKSPYFDMLYKFRSSLQNANFVFIIGYSLRDPTIGSIFEEVIAERIRKGDLVPLSENLDRRINEVSENHQRMNVVVINPNPEQLAENLKKQNNTNLLNTFIPIELTFPSVFDREFDVKYQEVIVQLINNLKSIGFLTPNQLEIMARDILPAEYNIDLIRRLGY